MLYGNWITLGEQRINARSKNELSVRCKCGTERWVSEVNLKNGRSKSCGCIKKRPTDPTPLNRIFGDWLVIKSAPPNKHGKAQVVARCKCGTEKTHLLTNLKIGRSLKCRKCHVKSIPRKKNQIDLAPGDNFGVLKVIAEVSPEIYPSGKSVRRFEMLCQCGTKRTVLLSHLRSGATQSCGACGNRREKLPSPQIGDWTILGKAEPSTRGKSRARCRCKCGIERAVPVAALRNGSSSGCGCSRLASLKAGVKPQTIHAISGQKFGDWTILKEVTSRRYEASISRQVLVRCICGQERITSFGDIRLGKSKNCGCSTESQEEKSLFEFVDSITNTSIIRNDRKALTGKEIDIFLPALKIGIEYNGNYWHSTARSPDKVRHFNKRLQAEARGIRLIQIRSDEWLNRSEIVKSILRNILGATENRLYARKLIIKKVPPLQAVEFLDQNHLMGAYRNAQHLGLYTTEDQLVQLFSYQIQREGTLLDCSRICALCNHVIVGGVSRLLKAVIKQHPKLTKVVSFVDLRYADGHSLAKMGFVLEKVHLGWGWVDGLNWHNRLQCRANMGNSGLTQTQQAEVLGWSKVYDAGQAKWVFKSP